MTSVLFGAEWFGPRDPGWGWTPVTWQGWVVVVIALALVVALGQRGPARLGDARTLGLVLVTVVAFVGVIALTGTPPG